MNRSTFRKVISILFACALISVAQNSLAENPEKEMTCIMRGAETVSFHYLLKNGNVYVDGEQAKNSASEGSITKFYTTDSDLAFAYAMANAAVGALSMHFIDFAEYSSQVHSHAFPDTSVTLWPIIEGECRRIQ